MSKIIFYGSKISHGNQKQEQKQKHGYGKLGEWKKTQ